MGRISRNDQIVHKMEELALDMIAKLNGKDITLDLKMDVFDRVGKWIAIKNKLENDDGGGIADYKRRLAGETDKLPAARRPRRGNPDEIGGRALKAIKSRIPAANAGGDDGNSGGAGGEVPAAAG